MPIKILNPETASKIAAGEVVEGPHSVIKELIENSIDASSTEIVVRVEDSGKKLIRVDDNGCGMSYEDLKLSIHRYSTSKISQIEDLNHLSTFGFRGEALFSIFSVSRISISTFDGKSKHGYKLMGEGGDFSTINISPSPPVIGTSVEVRDLFFNLPARLKFLKSDKSLKSAISKTFENISLAHPEIKFRLYIDNRKIYDLERSNILKRIESVLAIGPDKIITSKDSFDDFEIELYISKPDNLFSSKNYNYVYVNKRIVESKTVSNAIYRAFENIRGKKYPFFLVMIKINPSLIDVNVHPQKREVKFKDEAKVYSSVLKSVQNALLQHTRKHIEIISEHRGENQGEEIYIASENDPLQQNVFMEQNFIKTTYNPQEVKEKTVDTTHLVRFIGQAFSKILIFETKGSIILLDQHAAAERITFEAYIKEYESKNITRQNLLVPIEIKMNSSSVEKIIGMRDWLDEAGFEITQSSPTSIKVYSYPHLFNLSEDDLKEIMTYLADVISKPEILPHHLKRDIIATKACKASIKFNEFISGEKAIEIFENLIKTNEPFRCPHGRPTMVEISKEEIALKFSRPAEQI